MNQYTDFTSLPPEEESQFVVYEQRSVESGKKAVTLGIIVAAIFGLLTIIIVFSHDPPKNLMEGDDMGMLGDRAEGGRKANVQKAASAVENTEATGADEGAEGASDDSSGSAAGDSAATGDATDKTAEPADEPAAEDKEPAAE